mgnify:CR=1 FL=1
MSRELSQVTDRATQYRKDLKEEYRIFEEATFARLRNLIKGKKTATVPKRHGNIPL